MTQKALHLIANDENDLDIIAAATQDALFLPSEVKFLKTNRRFIIPLQRFRYELAADKKQRIGSLLSIESVLGVRAKNIPTMGKIPRQILNIKFVKDIEPPSGTIFIEMAQDACLELKVECVDLLLADIGASREAKSTPNHEV